MLEIAAKFGCAENSSKKIYARNSCHSRISLERSDPPAHTLPDKKTSHVVVHTQSICILFSTLDTIVFDLAVRADATAFAGNTVTFLDAVYAQSRAITISTLAALAQVHTDAATEAFGALAANTHMMTERGTTTVPTVTSLSVMNAHTFSST